MMDLDWLFLDKPWLSSADVVNEHSGLDRELTDGVKLVALYFEYEN